MKGLAWLGLFWAMQVAAAEYIRGLAREEGVSL